MRLNEIENGEKAEIVRVLDTCQIYRRLLDIGLIPGTKVECVLISPMKNPKAYMIRGAIIAIRNEDAMNIEINCIEGDRR